MSPIESADVILETRSLTKEFKGFIAVNDVNLQVRRGTIHALIGPNGAGKTTVFNLLTHFLQPTRGRIVYNGRDITGSSPPDIARLGMVRSFQISAVFPHLTVLENVRIALQRKRGSSFDFWRSERSLDRYDARARELIAAVEFPVARTGEQSLILEVTRRSGDYAMAGVAAKSKVSGNTLIDPRLVFFGVGDRAALAARAMAAVAGKQVLADTVAAAQAALAADLNPTSDQHGGPETKRHLARVLLARVLKRLSGSEEARAA